LGAKQTAKPLAMPWKSSVPMDQKVEFLATARAGHISVSAACDRFGISRKTGYKWINRYDEFGVRGLEHLSRAPKSHPHAVSTQVIEQLLGARRRHPHWGARTLVRWLQNHGAVGLPAPSTVTEVLRRHGMVKARAPRPATDRGVMAPQPDFDAPNHTWCADFKGQFQLRDRSWCYPLTVTDGFSRLLLRCHGLDHISAEPTNRHLKAVSPNTGSPPPSSRTTECLSPPPRWVVSVVSRSGGSSSVFVCIA
jgi:putative transposase